MYQARNGSKDGRPAAFDGVLNRRKGAKYAPKLQHLSDSSGSILWGCRYAGFGHRELEQFDFFGLVSRMI
jgi:hypothetical protein